MRFCDHENLCFEKKNLWTLENEFIFKKNEKTWILKTVHGLLDLLNFSDFFNQVVLKIIPTVKNISMVLY